MKLVNLKKIYNNSVENTVLSNINIDFDTSGLIFISGKSGSGKTTLLNLIGGLDKPTEGSIINNGIDITRLSNTELNKYRNNIGFIFQDYNLLEELTVYENITLALKASKINYSEKMLESSFKKIDLDFNEYKNKKIFHCSGGEKQRIAILRAILKESKIVLCDEPTGSLDSRNSEIIFKLLKELSKNKLIIVVSHDETMAQKYGDRIIYLSDGIISSDILKHKCSNSPNNDFVFNKGKTPIKHMINIGISNYKKHPLRLLFMFISLIISMCFCLLSLNLSLINQKETEINYINNNEFNVVKIEKIHKKLDEYNTIKNLNIDSLFVKQYTKEQRIISTIDYEIISSLSNDFSIAFVEKAVTILSENFNSIYEIDQLKTNINNDVLASPSGFSYVDFEKMKTFINITGEYPLTNDEILISDSYFNLFKKYGYKDINSNTKIDINSYNDLIGKEIILRSGRNDIIERKIVGIYNQTDIKTIFFDDTNCIHDYYNSIITTADTFNESLIENDLVSIYIVSPSKETLKNIINLNYQLKNANIDSYDAYTIIDIVNSFKKIESTFYISSIFKGLFLIISTIFLLISILTIGNSYSLFIDHQKKQIGILQALGISNGGINLIYIAISSVFSIATTFFSCIITAIAIPAINSYLVPNLNIKILTFDLVSIFIALIFVTITFIFSLIRPLIKLNKKKPIEIINEGKIGKYL